MTVGELVALGRRIMAVGAEERKAAKLATLRQGDAAPFRANALVSAIASR
ncbi:hypothetical protein QSJ19_05120 [Gordonia sp. ABSL11-1]|nr:hypothetical protein [Gordonia sp. ABSL11-1]MDL9944977.1 hypothetical protein [Gordonia sp. ABSL11-1]